MSEFSVLSSDEIMQVGDNPWGLVDEECEALDAFYALHLSAPSEAHK